MAFAGVLEEQLSASFTSQELSAAKLANRVQGLSNNSRGLAAELKVAQSVPGVIGLCQSLPCRSRGKHSFRTDLFLIATELALNMRIHARRGERLVLSA